MVMVMVDLMGDRRDYLPNDRFSAPARTIAISFRAEHAARYLTRTLDVLHVAAALLLEAKILASFDERQRRLASRCRTQTTARDSSVKEDLSVLGA